VAADIFISYSTQHPELTRALAAAVEAQYGVGSVWWDQAGLRAGDRFSEITTAQTINFAGMHNGVVAAR
jgi:hypothetical protein